MLAALKFSYMNKQLPVQRIMLNSQYTSIWHENFYHEKYSLK